MAKRYRWNKRKCAENLLELAMMLAMAGLFVWMTCTWIMIA